MTWVAWRQFRTPATVAVAAVALALALLAITGPRLAGAFDAQGLADCAAGREATTGTLTCGDLEREFIGSYPPLRLLADLLLILPALLGAFWGAPLIARELEAGTHRLAWVQSVTRTRWLAVKLALVIGVAVGVVALLGVAYTWWAEPVDQLSSRIAPGYFARRGFVPGAYVAFAIALGVAVGAVVRRTLPAMALAVAGFVGARLAVDAWVRPRLLDAMTLSYPTFTFFGDEPAARMATENGWVLSTRTVDGSGRVVSSGGTIRDDAAAALCRIGTDLPSKAQLDACGRRLGLRDVVRVVPDERFWALQAAEAALFVAAALALVGFSFWWVGRRATR